MPQPYWIWLMYFRHEIKAIRVYSVSLQLIMPNKNHCSVPLWSNNRSKGLLRITFHRFQVDKYSETSIKQTPSIKRTLNLQCGIGLCPWNNRLNSRLNVPVLWLLYRKGSITNKLKLLMKGDELEHWTASLTIWNLWTLGISKHLESDISGHVGRSRGCLLNRGFTVYKEKLDCKNSLRCS